MLCFFFSSRRRHTRCLSDWSSDVCSSDLGPPHSEEPRALILDDNGQDLYALSNESGNGTTGQAGGVLTDTILDLWPAFTNPSGPLPPDRDVIHFNVPNPAGTMIRSEEHTSELQSLRHLVC